jgi:cellulose synthase/poly-beta-1,6-N-acetylglucosamine synthase-like glycosyltransferase
MLKILLLVFYSLNVVLLFLYGIHTYLMVYWYRKNSAKCVLKDGRMTRFPAVTIQLPVFNEKYVAGRLIDYVIAIDYPKKLKEIQVLDDSTDETLEITRKAVEKYRRRGYDIKLIHRTDRTGHKGGALREALPKARGEFIAIFDADFIPPANFLKGTLPCFEEDPKIGMVQTRWGHVNAEYSLLTRAQALGVDGHFIIDQVARSGRNLYMNFNGTAGVWRKACILDAGNWQDDTLTEDFDLSYRAELRGWKFRFIKDIVNPSELPVQISAYKSQQFRWAKGSIQTALKLTKEILASKEPFLTKFEAVIHLTNYSVHPLLLLNIILTLPVLLTDSFFLHNAPVLLVSTVMGIATFGPVIFYSYSQYVLYENWRKRVGWVPFMMIVGTGIAVNNTAACLEAVFRKKSAFIRTPKLGVRGRSVSAGKRTYGISGGGLMVMFFELLLTAYCALCLAVAIDGLRWFAIPFMAIYCAAFGYVFWLGLLEILSQRRPRFLPALR